MKYLFVVVLLLSCQMSFAQVSSDYGEVMVDDVNINEIEDLELIAVCVNKNVFQSRYEVDIEYWGKGKLRYGDKSRDRGEEIKFSTVMSALNFLEKHGWKYVESVVKVSESNGKTSQSIRYIFRKK